MLYFFYPKMKQLPLWHPAGKGGTETMKQKLLALLGAGLLLILSACGTVAGSEPETPPASGGETYEITDLLGSELRATLEHRDTDLPVAVVYSFYGEGGGSSSPLYGEEAVNAVLDGILQLKVTGTTDEYADDYSSGYAFYRADGSFAGSISFNMNHLESGGRVYTVEDPNNAFPGVAFPGEGRFDALYPNGPAGVAAFFDRCQTETPVSLTVLLPEREPIVITDRETLNRMLSTVCYMSIGTGWAYEGDLSVAVTLTFAMADGTTCALSFADDQFLYEYPAPLGMWGFYTSDYNQLQFALDELG